MKKLILLISLLGLFFGGFGQKSLNQFSAASALADGDKIFVWQSGSKSRTFSGFQDDVLEGVSLSSQSSGTVNESVFFGYLSGASYSAGNANIGIGTEALKVLNSGHYNIGIGYQAGAAVSSGDNNIFMGYQAGKVVTTPTGLIFIGHQAGLLNTTGKWNIFIGASAGSANLTGEKNIYIGTQAGYTFTGSGNTYIGYNGAESGGPDGYGNIFVGTDVAREASTVNYSIAIGDSAGYQMANDFNTFIGHKAGYGTTTNEASTYVGYHSGMSNNGLYNVFMGAFSGFTATTAHRTIALGYQAGYGLTEGTDNVLIGYRAGYGLTSGSGNIGIGKDALYTATDNTGLVAIGRRSQYAAQTGAIKNTSVGDSTLTTLTIGDYNTVNGYCGLKKLTTGQHNSGFGLNALYSLTTESGNSALGSGAGSLSTADGCIYLGYLAGQNNATDNTLYIENSNTLTDVLIFGDFSGDEVIIDGQASDNGSSYNFYVDGTAGGDGAWNELSDSTLKTNIVTITDPLNKVMQLRGVTFKRKDMEEDRTRMGFIAQEAREIIPEVVDGEEGYLSIQYAPIVALLTEAIQDQQHQINSLRILLMFFMITILGFIGLIVIYIHKTRVQNYVKIK